VSHSNTEKKKTGKYSRYVRQHITLLHRHNSLGNKVNRYDKSRVYLAQWPPQEGKWQSYDDPSR